MIKNILIFILFSLLIWVSRDKFHTSRPADTPAHSSAKKIEPKRVTLPVAEPVKVERKITKITKTKTREKRRKIVSLDTLLNRNAFYDALSYYLVHSTSKNRKKMEEYLGSLSRKNPTLALEYMHIYLDEVPESKIRKLLVSTYIEEHQYAKAIEIIIASKENYLSESEDRRLTAQLKETALQYIDTLTKQKEYTRLIGFLEEMTTYDFDNSFYSFRLAQLYLELDKRPEASLILEELQYDEVYAQKVKSYMREISAESKPNKAYEYAIALTKYGEHYLVNVLLDGRPFRLMLDTGATYIYIDAQKGSMLEVIRRNLRLKTAGEDVDANLCRAANMQVGELELHNIRVTTAPFKRKGIDGLLGMNFLNRFKFFIDQERDILYLNSK